jgi:hypothetical protein
MSTPNPASGVAREALKGIVPLQRRGRRKRRRNIAYIDIDENLIIRA